MMPQKIQATTCITSESFIFISERLALIVSYLWRFTIAFWAQRTAAVIATFTTAIEQAPLMFQNPFTSK